MDERKLPETDREAGSAPWLLIDDIGNELFKVCESFHDFAYQMHHLVEGLRADIAETQRQVEELKEHQDG